MFQQLLPHASPAVLCLFKLGYPVVDAGIEFGERFFLLEN
jgi:hypothetical protein